MRYCSRIVRTMAQVTVSEQALRELVQEALDGGHLGDLTVDDDDEPVNVNPVVDPSASLTDPSNPDFVPQTKPELDVALGQLTKEVPIANVARFYKAAKAELDAEKEKNGDDEMKNVNDKKGARRTEEAVRRVVRKELSKLSEAGELPPVKKIPFGVHGAEYMRRMQKSRDDLAASLGRGDDDEEERSGEGGEEEKPAKRRHSYKKTAIGGMADVSGASFDEIAKELDFSIAGAKQAVDKALEKAQFVAVGIDSDDLEILVLTTMNDYVNMLNKTGELSPADVKLMKDHPDIVRELDGFREFLSNAIRRKRKEGQKLEDPLGEHKRRVAEALGSVGMHDEDDPAHQEHLKRGPECPQCGGENTEMNEPVPSMMGYGEDESLHCNDCDQDFAMNPFTGEFGGGKGKRSHLAREGRRLPKRLVEDIDPTKLKRGQTLLLGKNETPVKYVKRMGPQRPNYCVVELPDGRRVTAMTADLKLQVKDMPH